ncbi:DUF2478 domain-containing protein [Cognatishimia sp. WU-CL00825]|uniref:DUF2478 domain-containing protein n=1 Tax=Cognatishimia sp. WU-CL00825 TaxID=3127658 RepID=UPI003106AEE9
MNIAYTMATEHGATDMLLADTAQQLTDAGWRPCGIVQINTKTQGDHRCDMDVKILPGGPTIRISQSLGAHARGCRLNPSALEQSVSASAAELAKGADVLIVNKFGKHEAEGRGFRDLIAEALVQDVPVIVGVNQQNLQAFLDFTQGLATFLEPQQNNLLGWVSGLTTKTNAA